MRPRLIVGLGNPGVQYEGTRHNAGWDAVRYRVTMSQRSWFPGCQGVVAGPINYLDQQINFLFPMTMMNDSGLSVLEALQLYNVEVKDILVVCDDMSLEPGTIRLRPFGSSGGQKGLQNIIDVLKTDQFPRLRIGIGRPAEGVDVLTHVLSRPLEGPPRTTHEHGYRLASEAMDRWYTEGLEAAMRAYNKKQEKKADA